MLLIGPSPPTLRAKSTLFDILNQGFECPIQDFGQIPGRNGMAQERLRVTGTIPVHSYAGFVRLLQKASGG